jgi:hypothetical protein
MGYLLAQLIAAVSDRLAMEVTMVWHGKPITSGGGQLLQAMRHSSRLRKTSRLFAVIKVSPRYYQL